MKSSRFTRRQFLKAGAAGGIAAGFAGLLGPAVAHAQNPRDLAPEPPPALIPDRIHQSLADSPAAALPSALLLGNPLADISKGWDGSLWGIDTSGVPYHFDPIAQKWNVFGSGFDVITPYLNGTFYVIRGTEAVFLGTGGFTPKPISSMWSNLPDTFTQGIDGAAMAGGVLHLFRNGRYVTIDKATQAASAPVAVNTFANWPAADHWQQGAIDVVGSHESDMQQTLVLLWSKGEFVFVDMAQKKVIDGPHPLSYYVGGQMLAYMQQGFTTMLWNETNYDVKAFNGPVLWHTFNRNGTAYAEYPSGYYPPWVPKFSRAPNGPAGNLWAPGLGFNGVNYDIFQHDGTNWQAVNIDGLGGTSSLAVGTDGTVLALSTTTQPDVYQFNLTTGKWAHVVAAPANAVQLALADVSRMWVRTSQNQVYSRTGNGGFAAVDLGHPATDIAAGSDGTLWHAAGDDHIYRYLPGGTAPSSGLLPGVPAGTVIDQIAGTGFGGAYVLSNATAQLYLYDTPYVFKTPAAYFPGNDSSRLRQTLSQGGHTVFVSNLPPEQPSQAFVIALDAQTGLERWRTPFSHFGSVDLLNFYDSGRQLLYVLNTLDLYALNPDTGAQVWHLDVGATVTNDTLFNASFVGSHLCVTTLEGKLVLIDLDDALTRTRQNQPLQAPQPITIETGLTHMMGVPASMVSASDGQTIVYVASEATSPSVVRHITAVNAQTRAVVWQKPLALPARGFNLDEDFRLWWDIVIGTFHIAPPATPTMQVLFVNGANGIAAVNPADGSTLHTFNLPQVGDNPPSISSSLVYHDDRLYFGDSTGKLYVLNALTLTQITTTPDAIKSTWRGIRSAPVLIAGKTSGDGVVVAFTRGDNSASPQNNDQFIYLFDPATGILDQVRTDQSIPGTLKYDDAHGVLYAMAWPRDLATEIVPQLGQLFAIRPDSYIQDERSFIIESDLMQDYANDSEAVKADGSVGEGASRYHTHVTMVDDNNVPRANQSVKVWADDEATKVLIDGTAYTIGPNTPAFFTTDGTGSFTIISDATDLATTTLRVWSPFMDEHERIAIVPDAEFHNRLSATTASGSTDPQKIDMASATSYDGQPLFTDQTQAQQMATATNQLTSATGIGGNANAALRNAGKASRTHTSNSRYLTYSFLSSAAYTPVNIAFNRDVEAQAPLGLHINDQGHTPLTSTQAADLIDQMTGQPPTQLLGGILSDLKHAWQEIKQTAAKVSQVVVSVAKDVVAGIQYVVNGVTKVVKAVVKDIKEAVAAIGSLFVQLGKDLFKVLQALSKLLQIKKVLATAQIIRGQINTTLNGLTDDLKIGKTKLDAWIEGGEAAINNEFCNHLYPALGLPGCGQQDANPLSGISGMGATPTTIYSQATSDGSSQAVQCSWSTHALRNNMNQATTPTNVTAGITVAEANPLENLVSGFLDTLKTDPALKAAYDSLGQSFKANFKVTSPEQLLKTGLQTLLEMIRVIAVTGLAIGRAAIDTLLNAADILVQGLQNAGNIKIPVLSALWHALTGNDLTFLDVAAFVLAFPATFIYRAFQGHYPGDALQAAAEQGAAEQAQISAVDATTSVVSVLMGIVGSLAMLVAGVITAYIDGFTAIGLSFVVSWGWKIAGFFLLLANIGMGIYSAVKVPEPNNANYMLLTTSTLGVVLAIAGGSDPQGTTMANMIIGLFNLVFFSFKFSDLGEPVLTLTREVISTIPSLLNLIKFTIVPISLIAPAADLLFRWTAAGIQMAQTLGAKTEDEAFIYYLPEIGR